MAEEANGDTTAENKDANPKKAARKGVKKAAPKKQRKRKLQNQKELHHLQIQIIQDIL